jgi:hypothetical protein
MTLFLIVISSGNGYRRFYPHIDKLLSRCPYPWRADCRQELILCVFECQGSAADLSNSNVQTYISRRYRRFLKEEYEWRATKGTEKIPIEMKFDAYLDVNDMNSLAKLAEDQGYRLYQGKGKIILRRSLEKIPM